MLWYTMTAMSVVLGLGFIDNMKGTRFIPPWMNSVFLPMEYLVSALYVYNMATASNWSEMIQLTLIWAMALWPLISLLGLCIRMFSWQKVPYPDLNFHFPTYTLLEDRWETVRDEALAMLADKRAICMAQKYPRTSTLDANAQGAKCWKWFSILSQDGINPVARVYMPHTVSILEGLGDTVASASISILEPDTSLYPHVGYYHGFVRYHLGLDIPNNNTDGCCELIVAGRSYRWGNGRSVLFDDMFVHSARNSHPTKRRLVLFVDVFRKDLPQFLQRVNRTMVRRTQSAIQAVEGATHRSIRSRD